ncbi:MATE family efflux transporter [Mesobacillus zeae]|uniref:Probable multidrug resistance protein NorM n=1 Tax=Mesobacillus zeae TaxID=1917180 RepID=A0A398AX51_9BACI|nr:MATE family efflux transporter [Mesobacillus zeae]RID81624.1 MATE family efflux transporter [Mesobacillus zeae]
MNGTYNLTKGPITPTLMKLTLPIIATNFISTTYGLVDMIWVGKLGSGPVAAVGTASFFVNIGAALFTIISIGTGVKVAHSMGAGKEEKAKELINNGFLMSVLLAILYMIFILLAKNLLIGYFELGSKEIEQMAIQFLVISMIGTIFTFFNTLFSIVLNSMGSSGKPFRVYTVGFLINMILDPLLIFGVGDLNGLGVLGAALATLTANIIVTVLFFMHTRNLHMFSKQITFKISQMKEVLWMGLPITVQRITFTVISIIVAKIIVQWGPDAIAVQRVGVQIESISYMTIGGLQGAVAAFIGQNYGAKRPDRIKTGYLKALLITSIFGVMISILFILVPQQIFSFFLSDKASLQLGADYMRIIGFSQLFMCLELMTVGAFNGIGKTHIPPIFSIIFTALRIPLALMLSGTFELNGVWMSIALSSVIKGIVLVCWFMWYLRKMNQSVFENRLKMDEGRSI